EPRYGWLLAPWRESFMILDMRGRVAIVGVVSAFLCVHVEAKEGYSGFGHDRWHGDFYSKLNSNGGKGTCRNLMDCRPTQSRMVGDHYEVKVDGEWTPVPNDRINNCGRARWWRSCLRSQARRTE